MSLLDNISIYKTLTSVPSRGREGALQERKGGGLAAPEHASLIIKYCVSNLKLLILMDTKHNVKVNLHSKLKSRANPTSILMVTIRKKSQLLFANVSLFINI